MEPQIEGAERRNTLISCVALALLAGCGGSGVMPQVRAISAHADRGGSWMLPEAKSDTLIYASNDTAVSSVGKVLVFS